MLRYIKKCFFTEITFFSSNVLNTNSLSDSNGTRTHNHLVCKRRLNHLTQSRV